VGKEDKEGIKWGGKGDVEMKGEVEEGREESWKKRKEEESHAVLPT